MFAISTLPIISNALLSAGSDPFTPRSIKNIYPPPMTSKSSFFKAPSSGSIARLSFISASARDAHQRTQGSSFFKAAIKDSTERGSYILHKISATLILIS
jgi:hypothetical protein